MTGDPNWTQVGPFIPIATLSSSYDGPVVLADETQTIRWFVPAGAARGPVEHREHARNDAGLFQYQEAEDGEEAEPLIETRTVAPAFWAMAEVLG